MTKTTTLPQKALAAAKAQREKHCDAGAQRGDTALTGKIRKEVLTAALLALTDKERATLHSDKAEAKHLWLRGILHHAGCMLASPEDSMAELREGIAEGLLKIEDASPSMPGPFHLDKALTALANLQEEDAKAAKEPKEPKQAKKAKLAKPPKRAEVVSA